MGFPGMTRRGQTAEVALAASQLGAAARGRLSGAVTAVHTVLVEGGSLPRVHHRRLRVTCVLGASQEGPGGRGAWAGCRDGLRAGRTPGDAEPACPRRSSDGRG